MPVSDEIFKRLRLGSIMNPPMGQMGLSNNVTFDMPSNGGGMVPNMPPMGGPPMGMPPEQNPTWQPSTSAANRFNSLMSSMPQRENPGALRSIAALLSAIPMGLRGDIGGGINTGMGVLNQPFNQKMQDWQTQIDPAREAAQIEHQQNTQGRLRQADEDRTRLAEKRIAISDLRAKAYDFKARNPNMQVRMPAGGNIILVNPQTGQTIDTGVATGTLDEKEKLDLQQEFTATQNTLRDINDMEQINRRGEIQAENREAGAWIPIDVGGTTMRMNTMTGKVQPVDVPGTATRLPTGGGNTEMSPSATKIQEFNKARELVNKHPDMAKYIKFVGTNDFTIKNAPPTELQFINDFIYGRKDINLPATNSGSGRMSGAGPAMGGQNTNTGTDITNAEGMIMMESPNGTKHWVPSNMVQEALNRQFKKVTR